MLVEEPGIQTTTPPNKKLVPLESFNHLVATNNWEKRTSFFNDGDTRRTIRTSPVRGDYRNFNLSVANELGGAEGKGTFPYVVGKEVFSFRSWRASVWKGFGYFHTAINPKNKIQFKHRGNPVVEVLGQTIIEGIKNSYPYTYQQFLGNPNRNIPRENFGDRFYATINIRFVGPCLIDEVLFTNTMDGAIFATDNHVLLDTDDPAVTVGDEFSGKLTNGYRGPYQCKIILPC